MRRLIVFGVAVVVTVVAGQAIAGSLTALSGGSPQHGDNQTSIWYDPSTGELSFDTPAGKEMTSINIDSAACIFTGAPAENLGGSFDNDSDCNIFKATFGSSFGELSFGNVAQTGLSFNFLVNDLTVVGSLAGGGGLGPVGRALHPRTLIPSPGPARRPRTAALAAVTAIFAGTLRRRLHWGTRKLVACCRKIAESVKGSRPVGAYTE